jgi:hypothetical protein
LETSNLERPTSTNRPSGAPFDVEVGYWVFFIGLGIKIKAQKDSGNGAVPQRRPTFIRREELPLRLILVRIVPAKVHVSSFARGWAGVRFLNKSVRLRNGTAVVPTMFLSFV